MSDVPNPPTAEQLKAREWPLRAKSHGFGSYGHEGESAAYPAVETLLKLMDEHGIPRTAEIGYNGCGSHELVVTWEVA